MKVQTLSSPSLCVADKPMSLYIYVLLMISALAGLSITSYIHRKKNSAQPLVCPVGSNCEMVVHSEYSKLFDIPLEVIGALYYMIIVLTYSLFLVAPEFHSAGAAVVILELTTVAFLFSLYLISVQAFVLKEWCMWCLGSTFICSFIFFIEFRFVGFDLVHIINKAFF